jgi:hypothetical protein
LMASRTRWKQGQTEVPQTIGGKLGGCFAAGVRWFTAVYVSARRYRSADR